MARLGIKLWLPVLALLAWILWSAGSPPLGQPLPSVSLAVVTGEGSESGDRVSLTDLAGKVVLLDFWASFCAPCRDGVPLINAVDQAYRARGLAVYGVNAELTMGPGRLAFIAGEWGFGYPTLADSRQELRAAFEVEAFPTLLLFDPQGHLRYRHVGTPSRSELDREISKLIK